MTYRCWLCGLLRDDFSLDPHVHIETLISQLVSQITRVVLELIDVFVDGFDVTPRLTRQTSELSGVLAIDVLANYTGF